MNPYQGTVTSISQNFQRNSIVYQSIPSLTIPPSPPGIRHVPTAWGSGFRPTFLARGLGFRIREIFYIVRKEKCRNFSICFKETGGRMKSRCSCAVSYQFLQKQWISTVSLTTQTVFGHFDKISQVIQRSFLQMLFHH